MIPIELPYVTEQLYGRQRTHPLGLRYNQCPIRVEKAAELFSMLVYKELSQGVAAHGYSGMANAVEVVEGKPLDKEEVLLKSSVTQLLQRWFDGTLEPNEQEGLEQEALCKELRTKPKRKSKKKSIEDISDHFTFIVTCPRCRGQDVSCVACRGTGKVGLVPMMPPEIKEDE